MNDKILVLADSNKAVDNLTLKLMKKKLKVIRVMSISAQKKDYDKSLDPVCFHYIKKKKASVEVYKLVDEATFICCTLETAVKLSKKQEFQAYNFPFSLVDEATQCHELQTIKAVTKSTKKFILVGDQCQLGPVFQSQESEKFGITSTFERLVNVKDGKWVRLRKQYRMHSTISDLSSKLFYDGEIQTGIKDSDRTKYKQYKNIFKSDQPIIFYNISGKEKRQRDSIANDSEKRLVLDILAEFLKNPGFDTSTLAIISNYSSQIYNIKSDLRKNFKFNGRHQKQNLEVDTVDAFQGREKDFVIISTVRANQFQQVGFLKDSRRMNVAITRAKHGVVIIGNRDTLQGESMWNELILHLENKRCVYREDDWGGKAQFGTGEGWIQDE